VPATLTSAPEALLEALDPEQREVALALTGPVAVIAGAGTGKTRAITHRIAYGVATGVYNPTSVLAVTFTTRAAGELRGRLQRLGAAGVQARTFHAAALRQAQYFWPRVYGGELPAVLDNRMGLVAEAASRLRVKVDTPRLRDLVGEIAWAKVSNVGAEDYVRLAGAARRELASFDVETVARVFAAYERVKQDRSRIDFEDILLCAAALMSDHPEVAETIRRTYRHLVVDEYQDVSPLQEALLTLWRGDRTDLCVVGDPAQTIHTFAGARASYLTGFATRFPGAAVIRLVRDYRSTPQVVGLANAITASATGGATGRVELQAQQPPGPEIELTEAPDEGAEAAGIADWLARQAAAGTSYREMAVLFRINAQSPPIEQALADRGIPYLVRGGERFYERPEVRQALLVLRNQARVTVEDEPGDVVEQVKAVLGTLGWTEQQPDGAGAVRERWESLSALVTSAEDLADEMRSDPSTTSSGDRLSPGSPRISLADVSAELDRRAEAQHVPSAQGVTVGTLHSAKGLEWDAVALLGIHEGSMPFVLATTSEQVEEERRLLYVGVTRARRLLRVSWSRTRNGGGNPRKPSRFLTPVLPAAATNGRPPGPRGRSRGTVLSAHCRSCGRPVSEAAERKMGRHAGCPATYDEQTMSRLREWRRQEAAEQKLPAYCIFTDATLVALAESRPRTAAELIRIQGLGPAKASKYGEHVLAILAAETSP
jgi:DNA helicase II / ATP-dependent DNA helicase PcrA